MAELCLGVPKGALMHTDTQQQLWLWGGPTDGLHFSVVISDGSGSGAIDSQ